METAHIIRGVTSYVESTTTIITYEAHSHSIKVYLSMFVENPVVTWQPFDTEHAKKNNSQKR